MKRRWLLLMLISVVCCSLINVNAAEKKVLTFSEGDGKFVYSLNTDQFMSFNDMVPGGKYYDHLGIVNECKDKKFDLYFQIMPVDQSSIANELLEHISMEIVYGDTVLYSGRATGLDYKVNDINLQNKILLGTYEPSEKKDIDVYIRLDDEIDDSLMDVSSRIDWEFTIMYDDVLSTPDLIKTGDNAKLAGYIAGGAASMSVLFLLILVKHKQKESSVH